jgi:hypothetical protein
MVWNSTGKSKQGYGFSYEGLNSLTLGDHKAYSSSWTDNTYYEEKSLAYDPNGDIKRLVRTNSSGATAPIMHTLTRETSWTGSTREQHTFTIKTAIPLPTGSEALPLPTIF